MSRTKQQNKMFPNLHLFLFSHCNGFNSNGNTVQTMQNYYWKIRYASVILLLLLIQCRGQFSTENAPTPLCRQKTFKTSQTRCTITFQSCENEKEPKFLKCSITNCQRHLGTQNCQRSLDFQLSQKACYRQCCKSDIFDEEKCQSLNSELKQSRETQDRIIILILGIILGGLLVFSLIFFLLVLKCNNSTENNLNEENNHQQQQLFKWQSCKYLDPKCDFCSTFGAVIFTPCNHAYHLQCYLNNVKPEQTMNFHKCPQKILSSIKILCGECRQKYIKIKATKVAVMKDILTQMMIQHSSDCSKFYDKEVETDVRLTSTGSED